MLTFTLPGLARTLKDIRVGCYLKYATNEHSILEIPAGTIVEIAAIEPLTDRAWLRHPDMQDGSCFYMEPHEYSLLPEGY